MNHRNISIILSSFLIIFIKAAIAQKGTDCVTPDGEIAKCTLLPSCQILVEALQTRSEEALNYTRRSHCGFEGKIPLVCCGTWSLSEGNPVDKLIDNYYNMLNTTGITVIDQEVENVNNNNNNKRIEDSKEDMTDANNIDMLQDKSVCGLEKHESYTHDGLKTDFHEFPWTVVIEYKETHQAVKCIGTIINSRYILTTATCIENELNIPVSIHLGEWDITSDPDCRLVGKYTMCTDPIVRMKIARTIPHPFYSKRTGSNDIGLIMLEKDIHFTEYIRPICLPSNDLPAPEEKAAMTVTGWGVHNYTQLNVKVKGTVSYLSNNDCRALLEDKPTTVNLFCACGEKSQMNDCYESLGGPVMRTYTGSVAKQRQWYLEGIVINGCGGYPVIYTRVSRYVNWIIDTVLQE